MERIISEQYVKTTEEFLNQCHSNSDYDNVAFGWCFMHRLLQYEGWKLLKKIIKAVAQGGYDGRNQTAHDEAAKIYEYMRDMHINC